MMALNESSATIEAAPKVVRVGEWRFIDGSFSLDMNFWLAAMCELSMGLRNRYSTARVGAGIPRPIALITNAGGEYPPLRAVLYQTACRKDSLINWKPQSPALLQPTVQPLPPSCNRRIRRAAIPVLLCRGVRPPSARKSLRAKRRCRVRPTSVLVR